MVLAQIRNQRLNNLHAMIRREGRLRGDILRHCHMCFGERRQIQTLHRKSLMRSPCCPTAGIIQKV